MKYINTKIRIKSPEHSEYVQKELFNHGHKWAAGEPKEVRLTDRPYLFVNKNGLMLCGRNENTFNDESNLEIFIDMPGFNLELFKQGCPAYTDSGEKVCFEGIRESGVYPIKGNQNGIYTLDGLWRVDETSTRDLVRMDENWIAQNNSNPEEPVKTGNPWFGEVENNDFVRAEYMINNKIHYMYGFVMESNKNYIFIEGAGDDEKYKSLGVGPKITKISRPILKNYNRNELQSIYKQIGILNHPDYTGNIANALLVRMCKLLLIETETGVSLIREFFRLDGLESSSNTITPKEEPKQIKVESNSLSELDSLEDFSSIPGFENVDNF